MKEQKHESQAVISDSSEKLVNFLEETSLHKKDFAEMIGVTLSYVYSLIDNTISFSTRSTTIERIAVIMEIAPEKFPEYKIAEEPHLPDQGVEFLKEKQKKAGLTNLELIKKFPRKKRVEIVDLWRGACPLPLDWNYLYSIAEVLDVPSEEIYPYWENRVRHYLMIGGVDIMLNNNLINSMFNGAKSYLKI